MKCHRACPLLYHLYSKVIYTSLFFSRSLVQTAWTGANGESTSDRTGRRAMASTVLQPGNVDIRIGECCSHQAPCTRYRGRTCNREAADRPIVSYHNLMDQPQ